jgi:hypothetical protein
MLTKSFITSAVIVALAGCMATEKTRFVGEPIETTDTTDTTIGGNSESNVMFKYEGEELKAAKKQSIIEYQVKQKKDVVVNNKYRVVDASDLVNEAVGLEVNEKQQENNNVYPLNDLIVKENNLDNNIKPTPVEPKQYVLTPEDKIMASTIDPLLYQIAVEFNGLLVSHSSDRLLINVDIAQAKASLINRYYNTDDIEDNDREPIERPTALLTFKGKKGYLKDNLEMLLSHSRQLSLINDISENHFLDYDFEIKGASVLHILDELVAPFKSPHPVKVKIYSKNKAAHVYYSK